MHEWDSNTVLLMKLFTWLLLCFVLHGAPLRTFVPLRHDRKQRSLQERVLTLERATFSLLFLLPGWEVSRSRTTCARFLTRVMPTDVLMNIHSFPKGRS